MTEQYHLECPVSCSLRPDTNWGDRASYLLFSGLSLRRVVAIAKTEGFVTNVMSLSRHRKHIVVGEPALTEEEEAAAPAKVNNIEILESIIQKGFQNQRNWKPTISDTMKAMDMWFRLTQGNPFDDLLDTLASASMTEGGTGEDDESDPANGTVEETSVEDDAEG